MKDKNLQKRLSDKAKIKIYDRKEICLEETGRTGWKGKPKRTGVMNNIHANDCCQKHQNQDESPQNGYLRGEEVKKIGSQGPGKETRKVSKNRSVSEPKST